MNRKNLLTVGCLICIIIIIIIIIVSVMMAFIFYIPDSMDNSATILNSTNSYAENSVFDNKTPEEKAIFIARLSQGTHGFDDIITTNASLTHDGNYWIVEMYTSEYQDLYEVITVDPKTWMSKEDNGTWMSLDKLKANYIAEVYCMGSGYIGPEKPYNVTLNGKTIWKVPCIHSNCDIYMGVWGYVYFDPTTGKSKGFSIDNGLWDGFKEFTQYFPGGGTITAVLESPVNIINYYTVGTGGGSTLKELDDYINEMYADDPGLYSGPIPFKNALRDLYPE